MLFWKKKIEKKEEPRGKDTLPAVGPMTGQKFNIYADLDDIDPEQLAQHIPRQAIYPVDDKNFKTLSARQINTLKKRGMLPHIYANPMQHLDYRIYESILKHTFVGALADAFIQYLVGTGFKPELELINPNEDDEKNKKLIDENQDIITDLLKIDNQIEKNDDETLDTNFKQKISALIMSTLMYNRGALMFVYEKPVKVRDRSFSNIPSHLIFAHAQDLGMIDTDPATRRLKAVQWRHSLESFTAVRDMIYLWNPITSSKVHNSWHYGTSILSPMMSASKLIRTILSETFPAMAKSTWAGVFFLIVKNEGNTRESKIAEHQEIAKGAPPGNPNVLVKDPDDVKLENINYDPKITELKDTLESMIKLCISIMRLPQVGFYDEAAANRACYSADTLTLTESGYKPYHQIDWRKEKIATLNPETNKIEYHIPDGIYVGEYKGDMIHIQTKNQDIMVTPDHDMWVSRSHDPRYLRWEKIKAEKLLEKQEWVMAEFGEYTGTPVPENYQIKQVAMGVNQYQNAVQVQYVKTDIWLEFLGYYLSEGTKSYKGNKHFVSVAQNFDSTHYDKMKKCMDAMPFNYYLNSNDKTARFRFNSKQLVGNLDDTGLLHDTKQIPRWVMQLQPDKLSIIFDALMAGDGTVNKQGSKIYYTTSYQLAQDVQELANKLGYSAHIRKHYSGEARALERGRPAHLYADAYRVFIKREKGFLRRIRKCDISKVPYDGMIYCYGVKNHLFVTQRNGCTTVQGNTMVGKIQLTMRTTIEPMREWIGEAIAQQWYQRWFELIYKDTDLPSKFKIKMSWADLHIAEWYDSIEAIMQLDGRQKLKNNEFGELVGLDNYDSLVDPDAEPTPGGQGKMSMKDQNGNKLEMSKGKKGDVVGGVE